LTLRLTCSAVLSFALASTAGAADPPPVPKDFTPVEFTISGGISLGNYEAGLNWAVVRLIKLHEQDPDLLKGLPPPKMVAVTGASAGNINALIAAIEYCRSDNGGASPVNNAFYQSWMPVGWDGLFAGDRTCVQYCHDLQLESTWAARLGAGSPDPCLTACQKDCKAYGGKDCEDGGAAYRADDAVFTRRAFLGVEESFRAAVEKATYDPHCKLAVGVTTTKFNPTLLDVTGAPPEDKQRRAEPPYYVPLPYSVSQDGLTVESQRYVTALRAETRGDRFGYYEYSFQDDHTLGSYLHLPRVPNANNRVSVDDILALTEASSAFPIAFGPRKLRFCEVTPTATRSGPECVENTRLTHDWFIDGGAFDNVPLGLGYSLTDAMVERLGGVTTKERHFFYIDPERRRYLSSSGDPLGVDAAEPTPVSPSLSEVATLAGNFYAVAGKYELQTVARYVWREDPGERPPRLLIAGRLTPIVGEYLYAFGAFLARPFRVFDFNVGAYDGAYDFARWICDQEVSVQGGQPGARSRARCMFELMKTAYGDLGMSGEEAGEPRFLYHSMLEREFRTWARLSSGAEQQELQGIAAEAAAWSKSQGYDPAKPPNVAMGALIRAIGTLHDEEVDATVGGPDEKEKAALVAKHRGDFAYFLKLLGKDAFEGYSEEERELLADPEAFTNRALLSILSRSRQIEAEQNNETTTRALIFGQVAVLSQQSSKMLGLEIDPSSIPDDNILTVGKVAALLLPYRIMYRRPAYDTTAGFSLFNSRWNRLDFSYEPTFGFAPDWALILPVGAFWQFNASELGLFATPGLLWRNHQALFAGLDGGLKVSKGLFGNTGFDSDVHLGAELGARVLGGKIRLSLSMDNFATPNVAFGIGLIDFNGMLYWTFRIIQGR